jgi:hypothetical protein
MFGVRGCGFECSFCTIFPRCGSAEGETVVSPGAHVRFLIDYKV